MEEIFKKINGFEDYFVSNLGRVKNKENIVLKPRLRKFYLAVNLYKNGIIKTKNIHRLVAENFIENNENYTCVNHKDENKINNTLENLEWCTFKENSNYGNCKNKISEKVRKEFAYYETNPVRRGNFKSKCKKENICFENFNEVFSGEKDFTNKKYFYFLY